jgi:hypothetical protein
MPRPSRGAVEEDHMGKRDDLIASYAKDLREKCGVTPDMDLLTKVTIGLGPVIYSADSMYVAGSDRSELDTVRKNFLLKKLGLADTADLDAGLDKALDTYGRSETRKFRAVFYYLLTVHFGKQGVYA